MIFTLIETFVGAEIGERFANRHLQRQDSAAIFFSGKTACR